MPDTEPVMQIIPCPEAVYFLLFPSYTFFSVQWGCVPDLILRLQRSLIARELEEQKAQGSAPEAGPEEVGHPGDAPAGDQGV